MKGRLWPAELGPLSGNHTVSVVSSSSTFQESELSGEFFFKLLSGKIVSSSSLENMQAGVRAAHSTQAALLSLGESMRLPGLDTEEAGLAEREASPLWEGWRRPLRRGGCPCATPLLWCLSSGGKEGVQVCVCALVCWYVRMNRCV